MVKKPNKKLLEQMTISERFNYISALKQMEHSISKTKDNVSENDNGIWDASNKGIKLAKGKFIGLLDSGDIFQGTPYFNKYKNHIQTIIPNSDSFINKSCVIIFFLIINN